jgi:hypothetical protein
MGFVQGQGRAAKQPGQKAYGDIPSGGTLVYFRFTTGDSGGIVEAARVGAQRTLGLWQTLVNVVDKPGI